MALILEVSSNAFKEFEKLYDWYFDQDPNLAARFELDYFDTLERIKQNPNHYLLIAPRLRRCSFKIFQCMVIYSVLPNKIYVTATKDMRSKPNKNFF